MNSTIQSVKMLLVAFIFVFGIVSIIGSNGDSGGGDDDGSGQTITFTGSSGNPVSLDGDWSEGCEESEDESESYVLTVAGTSFSQVIHNYGNVIDCSGSPDIIQTIKGTVTLVGEKEADFNGSPVTVGKFDGTFTGAQATIKNQDTVDEANADTACGFDDWQVDVTKDIFDTDCFDPDKNFKAIIYIDDTAEPDLWYDGDDDLALDADGYPTVVDTDSPQSRL